MTDEEINKAMKEATNIDADFCTNRDALEQAHSIMAFKNCGAKATDAQWAVWQQYGYQLFKDGFKIWQLSNRQWAEAYLRTLGKWEDAQ